MINAINTIKSIAGINIIIISSREIPLQIMNGDVKQTGFTK